MIFKNRFCINKTAFTLAEVFHHAGQSHKFAFTLAEVLITLGVIGIVAALTMPSLIQNYQKKVLVNQLKKHVSVMSQGIQKMLADEGVQEINQTSLYNALSDDPMYCLKQFNDTDYCGKTKEIITSYFKAVDFPSNEFTYYTRCLTNSNYNGDTSWDWGFPDGSLLWFEEVFFEDDLPDSECEAYKVEHDVKTCTTAFSYYVDVNGEKGPNQYGRDIFDFYVDAKGQLWAYGFAGANWRTHKDLCGEPNKKITSNDITGYGCAARIIENGWQMDY